MPMPPSEIFRITSKCCSPRIENRLAMRQNFRAWFRKSSSASKSAMRADQAPFHSFTPQRGEIFSNEDSRIEPLNRGLMAPFSPQRGEGLGMRGGHVPDGRFFQPLPIKLRAKARDDC